MPMSPQEIVERKRKEAQVIIDKETKNIEDHLIDGYDGTQAVSYYSVHMLNSFVRTVIINNFRGAGWKVDWIDDQRDGIYLKFDA